MSKKDLSEIVGMEGGRGGNHYKILAEIGRGMTKYNEVVVDGKRKYWHDFERIEDYFALAVTRERATVRFAVEGSPIAAESAIRAATGWHCMATTPNTVDVYVPTEVLTASELGARGGASTSDAKKRASRENGKKGGRPAKVPQPVKK